MATTLRVDGDSLVLELRGIDALVGLGKGAQVPLADVTGARITTWDDIRPDLGWRTFGSYVPRVLATGWYAVPGRAGARQFLSIYRERDRLVVVDTRLAKPARLVVQVPDPEAAVAAIDAAISAG